MKCTLCDSEEEELTHLTLYVIGSEGINVCLHCRIMLSTFAESIMKNMTRIKMQIMKDAK